MKVLLICPVFPPEAAPAGVMTRELAEDLSARGHQVDVMTAFPNQPGGKVFEGFRRRYLQVEKCNGYRLMRIWHSVPDKSKPVSRLLWWFTFATSSFLHILRLPRYDVVYAHPMPIVGSVLNFLATRLKREAYLHGVYDVYPETVAQMGIISRKSMIYRLALRLDTWLCRRVEGILTLSEGLKATLCGRGIDPAKVNVVPFWLDEKELSPQPRDNAWRRENNIGPETFVVLYAGTIGHISGARMLTDVAAKLADVPNLLFLLVGAGVAKDEVMERCRELNLKNMRFLPFQPRQRLAEVQSAADIGVITLMPGAGKNSLPSKMLGYIACQRGVLASVDADSDTAQCIKAASCGIVTPAQDVEAFVQAVRKAMEPGVAETLGRSAREYFLANHARDTAIKRNSDLLFRIARSWPGRPVRRGGGRWSCLTPLGREIPVKPVSPIKRLFDIVVSLAFLAVTSPLVLLASIAVKITSKGPVFYRGLRFGQGGSIFPMLKFRSMKVGAPAVRTPDGKIIVYKDDPRLTAIGKLLRKSKIDEIPQFLNVLQGQMSVVGPRPHLPTGEEEYDELGYQRLAVLPGITGLASVIGGRHLSVRTLDEVEARYAHHQSFWLDILICLATPLYVLAGETIPKRMLAKYIGGINPVKLKSTDTY